MNIIIGNIFGLIGSLFMVLATNSKKPRNVVKLQIVQLSMLGLSNVFLGAITGCISSIISIVRNLLCLHNKMKKSYKMVIVVVFVLLTIFLNTNGFVGWLPTIAGITLTLGFDSKYEKNFRFSLFLSSFCFTIFDFCIMNYITFGFDIVTTIVALYRLWNVFRMKDIKLNLKNFSFLGFI